MAQQVKNKPFRNFIFCVIGFLLNIAIIGTVVFFVNSPVKLYALDCLALANEVKLPNKIIYAKTTERYISAHAYEKAYTVLRKKPNADSEAIVRIANGTVATIRSKKTNGWYLITTDLYTGWVKSSCVYKSFEDKSDNVKPDKTYNFIQKRIIIDSDVERMSLLMKTGPGKEYTFIRRAPNGAVVNLVGTSETYAGWSYIEYRGTCGWVSNDSLYSISSADKYTVPVEPTYTSKTSAKIVNPNNEENIRVRIGPDSRYVFTDYVYKGDKVTILGSKTVDDVKWYCIKFKSPYSVGYYDETGWIQSKYVEKIK